MKLTVATWNIHGAVGTDRRFDLERTASVLRELDADVIALQEVGDFRGRTPHARHAEELARESGFHVAFAPTVARDERRYGNALLSRLPIAGTRVLDLSVSCFEPRNALVASLEGVSVCALHLGLVPHERRQQEERLARSLPPGALVVCGDFNHLSERSVRLGALRDAACVLGARARTCPSALPLFRFDRVLVSDEVLPLEVRVHRSEASRCASDHLPVVARLAVA